MVTPISVIFVWVFDSSWSDHHLESKFLRVSAAVAPVGCLAPAGIFVWELARAAWLGGIWKWRFLGVGRPGWSILFCVDHVVKTFSQLFRRSLSGAMAANISFSRMRLRLFTQGWHLFFLCGRLNDCCGTRCSCSDNERRFARHACLFSCLFGSCVLCSAWLTNRP